MIDRNWPSTGLLLAAGGIDHRREAEAHRVADHLAGDQRGGKADLDREAEGQAGHHLAADQHEALRRWRAPSGGRTKPRMGDRRDADRERDDQAQLHRHEGGAEDRRGDEGGAGADHRDQPEPELVLDARRSQRGSSHQISGMRAKMSWVKSVISIRIAPPNNGEADADDDQLGHEGQGLLVDRGRRLDHAEDQARR